MKISPINHIIIQYCHLNYMHGQLFTHVLLHIHRSNKIWFKYVNNHWLPGRVREWKMFSSLPVIYQSVTTWLRCNMNVSTLEKWLVHNCIQTQPSLEWDYNPELCYNLQVTTHSKGHFSIAHHQLSGYHQSSRELFSKNGLSLVLGLGFKSS